MFLVFLIPAPVIVVLYSMLIFTYQQHLIVDGVVLFVLIVKANALTLVS